MVSVFVIVFSFSKFFLYCFMGFNFTSTHLLRCASCAVLNTASPTRATQRAYLILQQPIDHLRFCLLRVAALFLHRQSPAMTVDASMLRELLEIHAQYLFLQWLINVRLRCGHGLYCLR